MAARIFWGAAVVFAAAVIVIRFSARDEPLPYEPNSKIAEAVPIAPWIEPDRDMEEFFPNAHSYKTERLPLSAQQTQLAEKLGRPLEPGENLLTIHHIYKGEQPLGSVVIRRVKGEHGAIDLVIALTEKQEIQGVRIQRSREPETVNKALENPQWLAGLNRRTINSSWQENEDLKSLPATAQTSAKAILAGARSVLILNEAARATTASKPHH